jgi:hypothetical protein
MKDLFLAHSFKVSVHSQLAPLFLGCAETENNGGIEWQSKISHLMVANEQRELERGWGKGVHFQGVSSVMYLLQPSPVFYLSTTSQIMSSYCESIKGSEPQDPFTSPKSISYNQSCSTWALRPTLHSQTITLGKRTTKSFSVVVSLSCI